MNHLQKTFRFHNVEWASIACDKLGDPSVDPFREIAIKCELGESLVNGYLLKWNEWNCKIFFFKRTTFEGGESELERSIWLDCARPTPTCSRLNRSFVCPEDSWLLFAFLAVSASSSWNYSMKKVLFLSKSVFLKCLGERFADVNADSTSNFASPAWWSQHRPLHSGYISKTQAYRVPWSAARTYSSEF